MRQMIIFKYHNKMIENSQTGQPSNNVTLYSVKYQIKEDPFNVPIKFKRQVPLNKNIFELNESLPKKINQNMQKQHMNSTRMMDPLQMRMASIKLLLIQKLNLYLSSFTIMLSIYEVYAIDESDIDTKYYLALLNFALTVIFTVQICTSIYFYYENQMARRFSSKYKHLNLIFSILLVLPAPTPWTLDSNYIFNLTILLRLYFPLNYFIRSSIYYEPRAARITNIYGMKPQNTIWFAWKAILNYKSIVEVLFVYFIVVLLFSHGLFVISQGYQFIDCFQIVLMTLPTVGFGEYQITSFPRFIIYLILVTGIALNAFVTFVILKNFQMSTNESQSYLLLNKLKLVEQIEQVSSQFIIRKIRVKGKRHGIQHQKDDSFKQHYKSLKTSYRSLNPRDCMYHFTCFRHMINELNVKSIETNNMTAVLLSRLASANLAKERNNTKEIPQSS